MKKIVSVLTAFILCISIFPIQAFAGLQESGIIHREIHQTQIAQNVTYKNIVQFTNNGWQNIHIIEADISGKYTGLKVLTPQEGIGNGSTLMDMVHDKEIIAAINGDFFISGQIYSPIGPVVENGEMQSSPTYRMDELSVFSLDENNVPMLDYWSWDIKLRVNGSGFPISAINKTSFDYLYPVIYTKDWGVKPPSVTFPDILYFVIERDTVREVLAGPQEGMEIPADGMVLMVRGERAAEIQQYLVPGSSVGLEIISRPDYSRLNLAIGGGSILVKDGSIYPFTHRIDGYHPRTALGFSKDGRKMFAVTVDGRTQSSAGMTQEQLAQFMIEIGAYNALNLDGGGSSTMLARKLGEEDLSLVNTPSDGSMRRISNGLGIESTAPRGPLKYIFLETADSNVFAGTGRTINVKGYDSNYNPVSIDERKVDFEVSGVSGGFSGSVFYPETAGNATVTAKYMGKTASISLKVLDAPAELILPYEEIKTDTLKSLSFPIYGRSLSGFKALMENRDVLLISTMGRFEGQTFNSGSTEGTGKIMVAYGQLSYEIPLSVGYKRTVVDNFEMPNGSFTSYPASVQGHYALDTANSTSGRSSGRLAYDFTGESATAASYLVFNGDGIRLDTVPQRIGVKVYNSKENNHWIRMLVEDANGKSATLDLARKLDWKGFKFIDAAVPKDLTPPVYIKRLYVVETNPIMHDSGTVLFDDLTAMYSFAPQGPIAEPKGERIYDPSRTETAPAEWKFSFSLFGSTTIDKLLDIHLVSRMKALAAEAGDLSVFAGSIGEDSLSGLKVPTLATQPGYAEAKYGDITFLKLDNSTGGLRSYSPQQWYWLKERLQQVYRGSLFLVLPKPVWDKGGFTDIKEAELLQQYLSELVSDKDINVYVLYGQASGVEYDVRDGVKYIGISGTGQLDKNYSIFDDFNYLKFYIDEQGGIKYQVLPLYRKP
ncbi:MAG: hypothetical protein HPY66_1522 [Firmicutes bacterium]|nr:hypothetical protein [Bacillota bacterium]